MVPIMGHATQTPTLISHRWMAVSFDASTVQAICTEGWESTLRTVSGLPEGAVMKYGWWDRDKECAYFVFEHHEFDEIDPNGKIPELEIEIKNLIGNPNEIVPTMLVDFDGTIYSYLSGWHGTDILPDEPVPGAKEAMAELHKRGFRVTVCSSRAVFPGGSKAIKEWMDHWGIYYDEVTHVKEPHVAFIDDRGVKFDGDWEDALQRACNTKPWWTANYD